MSVQKAEKEVAHDFSRFFFRFSGSGKIRRQMSSGGKATLGANVLIRINTPPKVTKLEFSIEAVHIMSVATLRRFSDSCFTNKTPQILGE